MTLIQLHPEDYDLELREYIVHEFLRNKCEYFDGAYTITITALMKAVGMLDEEIDEFMGRLYDLRKKGLQFDQSKKNPAIFTFYFEKFFR